jgi:hypothetical protein
MDINSHILENQFWKLELLNNCGKGFLYKLQSKLNGITYADQDYHYSIVTSKKKGSRYQYLDNLGPEYKAKNLISRKIHLEAQDILIVEGILHNTELAIKHEIKLKQGDKWLNEYISLTNIGNKNINLVLINFGFVKALFKQYQGWVDHLDEYQLISVPSRRFHRYAIDRKKVYFSANDILYDPSISRETEMPGFYAEGWLWGTSKGGLLVCKYNPSQIEFSRFSRFSTQLPSRGAVNVSIIFGGASLCDGNPELATTLEPNQSYSFGVSKYAVYKGDYKEGYYLYRSHLEENGHRFKKDYNPPVHWNELYNLGWAADKFSLFVENEEFKLYTLEQLYDEATLAKDIGAECLYLDPGWDTFLGSEIWNKERFGSLKDFSRIIHEKYGLKLALHLMMNFGSENEVDAFYLISQKGVRVVADPYLDLYCVCANEHWVKEKSHRLLELAKEGVDFFMFDFTDFSIFMADDLGCFNKDHGHEVPMRRQTHAQNIFRVIQNVKQNHPEILIEAHDRGVKHQLYFQHNLPYSFDENWGFECMWNPMVDLLSHRALQLYEYNLAYSIPLYLHINENSDNENMLQFWWYASVARHLGIGGLKDRNNTKYIALKNAMNLYKNIKPILTRGTFFGIDPTIHLHLAEDRKTGVIIAFNLTSRDKKLKIEIDIARYGLDFDRIDAFNGTNQKLEILSKSHELNKNLEFKIKIPSLTPIIVILK